MPSIDSTNQWQLLDRSSPGNVYLNIIKKNILVLIFFYIVLFFIWRMSKIRVKIYSVGENVNPEKLKLKKIILHRFV